MNFKPSIVCALDPGTKITGLAFTDSMTNSSYEWGEVKMLRKNGRIDVEESLNRSSIGRLLVSRLADSSSVDQSRRIVRACIERPTLHLKRGFRKTRHGREINEIELQSVCKGLNTWLQDLLCDLVQTERVDSLKWQRQICKAMGVRKVNDKRTYIRYAMKMTECYVGSSHSADALCMLDHLLRNIHTDMK